MFDGAVDVDEPLDSAVFVYTWCERGFTRVADSERSQRPAQSQHASVLWAESVQAVLNQLAQRLRQALQVLPQLRHEDGQRRQHRYHHVQQPHW